MDNPSVIIDVDSNALNKGQILVYDVLKQLNEIKAKLTRPSLLKRIVKGIVG